MDTGFNQLVKDFSAAESIRREDDNKSALRCYYMNKCDVSAQLPDDQYRLLFVLNGKVCVSIGQGYLEHIISSSEFILIPRYAEFACHAHERSRMVVVSFDGNYNSLNQKYMESLYSAIKDKTYGFSIFPIRQETFHFLNHISLSMGGTLKYHAIPEVILTLLRHEYSDTEMQHLLYPVLSKGLQESPASYKTIIY